MALSRPTSLLHLAVPLPVPLLWRSLSLCLSLSLSLASGCVDRLGFVSLWGGEDATGRDSGPLEADGSAPPCATDCGSGGDDTADADADGDVTGDPGSPGGDDPEGSDQGGGDNAGDGGGDDSDGDAVTPGDGDGDGDAGPVTITTFGGATPFLDSGAFKLQSLLVGTVAHVALATPVGADPIIAVACDSFYTRVHRVMRDGSVDQIANGGFSTGARLSLAVTPNVSYLVYADGSGGVAAKPLFIALDSAQAPVTIGSGGLAAPYALSLGDSVAVVATSSADDTLVFARIVPASDGQSFQLFRLDGTTGPITAATWGDALSGFTAAAVGAPRLPALARDGTGDRLVAMAGTRSAQSNDNAYAKVRQPLASGSWTASAASFSGNGITGVSDRTAQGSVDALAVAVRPNGRIVVAGALVNAGAAQGLVVAAEQADGSFKGLDGTSSTVITSVLPGHGEPLPTDEWDVGLCATDDAVLVFLLDGADANNVRGLRYATGAGWSYAFFDADLETEFDKNAGGESALAAASDGSTCYVVWEQDDTIFLAGFPIVSQ